MDFLQEKIRVGDFTSRKVGNTGIPTVISNMNRIAPLVPPSECPILLLPKRINKSVYHSM